MKDTGTGNDIDIGIGTVIGIGSSRGSWALTKASSSTVGLAWDRHWHTGRDNGIGSENGKGIGIVMGMDT